jgi:23S rRNA (cytosine1962-C5)-methyltransferase
MPVKIYLKKGRDETLKRFHPWIFSGAVDKISGKVEEGDVVSIYSHDKQIMGCGHYQIGSISVRMLSFVEEDLGPAFWRDAISTALKVRIDTGICLPNDESAPTNAFRLIHGEGDNLPGLIIDYYDGHIVIQAHSAGMYRSLSQISNALLEVFGSNLKSVYNKSEGTAPFKAGLELKDGYLYQSATVPQVVKENRVLFAVDWESGQKTGFFLDQRENRELVRRYSNGKRVLNLFCYTGGFSMYALSGGAISVDSVDSSAKAIEMLEKNLELNISNGVIPANAKHTSYCTDAIDFIKQSAAGKYDLMIVDPPAFAKHKGALSNALRAYQRLNAAAIAAVAPGGIVFTYSCSQVVDKISFAQAVFSAAAQTGRRVRIIHRLTQPADHSVNIYHPEGEYLKGLVLYVE